MLPPCAAVLPHVWRAGYCGAWHLGGCLLLGAVFVGGESIRQLMGRSAGYIAAYGESEDKHSTATYGLYNSRAVLSKRDAGVHYSCVTVCC